MKKHICGIAVFIFILLVYVSSVNAQNENDALRVGIPGLGASARALGMGNSYISLSDDASAAFFNPAGFGLIKRLEFSGGINYTNFSNSTDFFGNTSKYSNSNTSLDRISLAFPFPTQRGSLVFGLSYHTTKDLSGALKFDGFNNGSNSMIQSLLDTNVPYDLFLTDEDNNTPINGKLQQYGDYIESGSINNWTLSGAVEIYKNLFFGVNLDIITGKYEFNRDYYEEDVNSVYQGETAAGEPQTQDFRRFYFNQLIKWDISGWDAKFGLIYQFNKYARFGATIQFPKDFHIKEDFLPDGSSEFGTGTQYYLNRDDYRDQVEYDIKTPLTLSGGASVNIKGLIVSGEVSIVDYSQIEFSDPQGLSAQYVAGMNKNIKDLLRTTLNYNVGVEYTMPMIGLRLRGGFFVQPSPYEGDPSGFDKKYFTAGVGFLTDQTIGIDVGYAHGWWSDIGDNYDSGISRTYQDVTLDHIILGITYRF